MVCRIITLVLTLLSFIASAAPTVKGTGVGNHLIDPTYDFSAAFPNYWRACVDGRLQNDPSNTPCQPVPTSGRGNRYWYLSESGNYHDQESFVFFEFLPIERVADLTELQRFLQSNYPCYPWQQTSGNVLGAVGIAADDLTNFPEMSCSRTQPLVANDSYGVRYFMMRAGYLVRARYRKFQASQDVEYVLKYVNHGFGNPRLVFLKSDQTQYRVSETACLLMGIFDPAGSFSTASIEELEINAPRSSWYMTGASTWHVDQGTHNFEAKICYQIAPTFGEKALWPKSITLANAYDARSSYTAKLDKDRKITPTLESKLIAESLQHTVGLIQESPEGPITPPAFRDLQLVAGTARLRVVVDAPRPPVIVNIRLGKSGHIDSMTDMQEVHLFPDQLDSNGVGEIDLKPYLRKGWNTVVSAQVTDMYGLTGGLVSWVAIAGNFRYFERPCDNQDRGDCPSKIHLIEIFNGEVRGP